jgi:hypothetical protein
MSFSRLMMQRTLQSLVSKGGVMDRAVWALPGLTLVGWILWPALDAEWMIGMGLFDDPMAGNNMVQAAKDVRMAAKGPIGGAAAAEEEEEEEEAEEEAEEEEAAAEEEEEEEAAADEEEEEEKEEEAEEEDDEDEAKIVIKPLYLPTKAAKLNKEDMWDNFTIKAVRMSDDDDDDDDEDEDGTSLRLYSISFGIH